MSASGPAAVGEPLCRLGKAVVSVAFSPDGRVLAVDERFTVSLWDTSSHRQFGGSLGRPLVSDAGLAFSPDGRLLATGGTAPPGHAPEGYPPGGTGDIDYPAVYLWDIAGRRLVGEPLVGHSADVRCVAFSPDGHTLATAGDDGAVGLWDVATQQLLGRLQRHTPWGAWVSHVAFSPDGRTLTTLDDDDVGLWDVAGRQRRQGPSHPDWLLTDVALSPDGRLLATAAADANADSDDSAVRFWTRPTTANSAHHSPATQATSTMWPSALTAASWPPPAATAPRCCGTSPGAGDQSSHAASPHPAPRRAPRVPAHFSWPRTSPGGYVGVCTFT